MYEIQTKDYIQSKKILIDGKEWTMTAPGAGDELMLGQGKRRAERLEKKIAADTATDEEYDLYDKIEDRMFAIFHKVFKDGTEDNSEVKAWLDTTPMVIVYKIMEDITAQAEAERSKEAPAEPAKDEDGTKPAEEA